MADNKFIRFLIATRYAGVKVDREGNFKADLISVRFMVWALTGPLLMGLFFYCRLQHPTDRLLPLIVDAMAVSGSALNPMLTVCLCKVRKSSFFTATGFSSVRIFLYQLVTSLYVFPCAYLNLQDFGTDMFADVVLIGLLVTNYVGNTVLFEFLYVIIKSFTGEWKNVMDQQTTGVEDIKNIQEKYDTMKSGLQLALLLFFTFLQIGIILSITLVIMVPIYLVLISFCLGMIITTGTLVYQVEQVYEMLAEFSMKAEESLLQAASYRVDMMRFQKALDRLEGSGKASGFGFFEVDRTTLTSMLSTTLTYTIIMMQFGPGPTDQAGNGID